MASSDDRLVRLLEAEVARVHPDLAVGWRLDLAWWGFRIASPVEPCEQCGHRVYLILVGGEPRWMRIGAARAGFVFPQVEQVRHECGDGDAWSVEAALFAEQTLAEWGVVV